MSVGSIELDGVAIGIHLRGCNRYIGRPLTSQNLKLQGQRFAQISCLAVACNTDGTVAGDHTVALIIGGLHIQLQGAGIVSKGHVIGVEGSDALIGVADGHGDLHGLAKGRLLVISHGDGVALDHRSHDRNGQLAAHYVVVNLKLL